MGRAVHGGPGCRRVSVGISQRRVLVLAEWRAEEWVFRACAHRRVADRAMEARWRAAASVLAGQQIAVLIRTVNTPKRPPSFTRCEVLVR